jgi:hypothetical protein
MRRKDSVLRDVLQFVPWGAFERSVELHGADAGVRRLSCKSHFVSLLHAQLSGATSLRQISACLTSHEARLYHLGVRSPRRSTLADANAKRPAAVFTELAAALMRQATPQLRRHAREATLLLDASVIPLHALSRDWAREKKGTGAEAKLHLLYDAQSGMPVHFDVTPVRVNDITHAKTLQPMPGATYVFDLGYYDFGWWRRLADSGCRFVTRLKSHTRPVVLEEHSVPADSAVKADRIILIDGRLKRHRGNPLAALRLREVVIEIATGKRLRIVSNDIAAPAEEIAHIYKTRWQIELVFRWLKQNLQLTKFVATTENAVRTQIAVAIIAYLLMRIAHGAQKAVPSLLIFMRLVADNLMQPRSFRDLLKPPPDPVPQTLQTELDI